MLLGRYTHNVDVKGRLFMPVKLREGLGELIYVTKGLENCLYVYSEEEFAKFAEKLKDLPESKEFMQDYKRDFFGNTIDCVPDKQGRILISQDLREEIGLQKEAVIIGVQERVEIWAKEAYEEKRAAKSSSKMRQEMSEMGL